ncbi:acylneuraminate cytidylyltransferase family protein [Cyanobacterium sp. Dongsha4]|uniref:acylneuraminate cytidylyltransferase family protein n=1 Tax=Cyanobacterium sp. DS4 TaxID=2878255 RepID=UPI002E81FB2F|nr:acylneuraminate cytidylyltransferase family protein [Cyanobacterium sp. Dongsha4]WVL02251.1 acylneuraminate cytidylyltransferase family protein [Cyanobacterium sp. Dongsha4]
MINKKQIKSLAIIPARGGSKRLPKKNIQLLNNKPLVSYTIEAAIKSNCFDEILLSSDDSEILALADDYNEISPHKRPERLSGDKIKVLELVCEIAENQEYQQKYDVIALLLPTAPFRQARDIQAGFENLTSEIDSVVSITPYEFPPQLSVTLEEDNFIKPVFEPCPLMTGNTRSQDQTPIYRPNGGFYISWWKSFLVNRNYWRGKVKGHVMSRIASIDIDTQDDLDYAQFLLDNGKINIK